MLPPPPLPHMGTAAPGCCSALPLVVPAPAGATSFPRRDELPAMLLSHARCHGHGAECGGEARRGAGDVPRAPCAAGAVGRGAVSPYSPEWRTAARFGPVTPGAPNQRRRRINPVGLSLPQRIFRGCGPTPPSPSEAKASEYHKFDTMALDKMEEFLIRHVDAKEIVDEDNDQEFRCLSRESTLLCNLFTTAAMAE
ncbi:hypothetical protein EJB05_22055, partial [Eragrostis curvula]